MHGALRTVLASAPLVLVAGCLVPADAPPESPDREAISTDHSSPSELIATYGAALTALDLDAYVALLEGPSDEGAGGFTFASATESLDDFPWLAGDVFWSYEAEVAAIERLMDPAHEGPVSPVAAIDARLEVLNEIQEDFGFLVDARAAISVLDVASREWIADTRFHFLLVPDGDGYLRIRAMRELDVGHAETWVRVKRRFSLTY